MKRKGIFAILCIGVLLASAVVHANLARSNTTSILSDQVMAQTFGSSCHDCTLGESDQVDECYEDETCEPCDNGASGCSIATYGEGNYVYTCDSTAFDDGYCVDLGLVDCTTLYYCDIIGSWYSDKSCGSNGCEDPPYSTGCSNCEKGSQRGSTNQQMDFACGG